MLLSRERVCAYAHSLRCLRQSVALEYGYKDVAPKLSFMMAVNSCQQWTLDRCSDLLFPQGTHCVET
jgi:hypothetical protein